MNDDGLMLQYILKDLQMNKRIKHALSSYPLKVSHELNLIGYKVSDTSPNHLGLSPHLML